MTHNLPSATLTLPLSEWNHYFPGFNPRHPFRVIPLQGPIKSVQQQHSMVSAHESFLKPRCPISISKASLPKLRFIHDPFAHSGYTLSTRRNGLTYHVIRAFLSPSLCCEAVSLGDALDNGFDCKVTSLLSSATARSIVQRRRFRQAVLRSN